eukprot:TRINITY_DN1584_c0_g1_i1.p2 TRINITY_DN1584_c0_g1~~TRINITY_DN1584_c0_g1_i1.p2  ORF type:complete len:141 (+),score=30.64 TRINITY_DN1584_c0_g1_i1:326-748(+)
MMPCLASQPLIESVCTGCEPGYRLNPSTNKCDEFYGCVCPMIFDPVCCDGTQYSNSCQAQCEQATGCNPGECVAPSLCGGFANCVSYNDGCNHCVCGYNGVDACTTRYCAFKATARCTRCDVGYRLAGNVCIGSILIINR